MGNEQGPVPNRPLRFHMQQKTLSVQDLADLIAVDAKTVERWLSGETTPTPTMPVAPPTRSTATRPTCGPTFSRS